MDGCPYCDEWRYDPRGAPVVVRTMGHYIPVEWDGSRLRVATPSDPPRPWRLSAARHICEEHALEPEVLLLGPVRIEMY